RGDVRSTCRLTMRAMPRSRSRSRAVSANGPVSAPYGLAEPRRAAYHRGMTTTTTDRLPFTGYEAADRLLVSDPLALLIGFALDQQVPLQKAFSGPLELSRRIGGLDAKRIATME